jgi:predicted dehydrogenase
VTELVVDAFTDRCVSWFCGCAIFVEKPLALSSSEAFNLAQLIDESGAEFHCSFLLRAEKAFEQLRALLKAGALVRVLSVRASFGHSGPLERLVRRNCASSWGVSFPLC